MARFGLFGPSERHDVPPGGFCISTFALVRRGKRILVLRPEAHERWEREWTPNWRLYSPEQLKGELASWRLPSTYVMEGESPRDALDRVMVDQLGIRVYTVEPFSLENFYEESRRYPGRMHWDYCFVFPVSTDEDVQESPWIAASACLEPGEVKGRLGSAQEELLSRLRLI